MRNPELVPLAGGVAITLGVPRGPGSIELTRLDPAEASPAIRAPLDRTPLRAVLDAGSSMEAEEIRGADPSAWAWGWAPAERGAARAVPVRSPDGVPQGVLIAARPERPLTDDERRALDVYAGAVERLVDLASSTETPPAPADLDHLNATTHELRAPLTVISGYVSLIRSGSLGRVPEQWETAVEAIGVKAEEARQLVENQLLAARLGSRGAPGGGERIDLVECAASARDRSLARAELLHGTVTLSVPDRPVWGRGNRFHLARILDNLLNNALTYGGDRPRVTLTVAGGPSPCLRVADRGQGISEEMRSRIFDRFIRADDHSEAAGSGLGLYVSRQLAESIGARLRLAHTEPGKGSVFELSFEAG